MKKLTIIIALLLGIQLILSSCASDAQVLQSQSPTQSGTVVAIPTPGAGNATITGILEKASGAGGDPVQNTRLSLGKILENDQGTPMMAQLDSNTKLRTKTDENGRFLFQDVPAGKYVLISDHLLQAYMLKDPKTGGNLIIVANPGQIVDLGKLVYDQIP